jgi:hypothetical protein
MQLVRPEVTSSVTARDILHAQVLYMYENGVPYTLAPPTLCTANPKTHHYFSIVKGSPKSSYKDYSR